jgi:hypothetical protein
MGEQTADGDTHGNAILILLADAFGLGLSLLEGVLVLELAAHFDDGRRRRGEGGCLDDVKQSMSKSDVCAIANEI